VGSHGRRVLVYSLIALQATVGAGAQVGSRIYYDTLLSPPGTLTIVRRPPAAEYRKMQGRGWISSLPTYRADVEGPWQVDIRSCNLSSVDVTDRLSDLLQASFDSLTVWPARLPTGFDAPRIMELGKNPGLGIRTLHGQGVTGSGVGLAIIDQALLVDHREYQSRLRLYEEIDWQRGSPAQMHAPAVASIAVGENVGVAPDAELYFIATSMGGSGADGTYQYDLKTTARAIDRIVEVNRSLPAGRKIRVISISLGLNPDMRSFDLAKRAIDDAAREGIYTVYVSSDGFIGLGRQPLADPESSASYEPGQYWAPRWKGSDLAMLMVPMDSRCTASPTGSSDYVFYRTGGMSWAVPWIAGLYALACQVKPDITPQAFWEVARKTSVPAMTTYGGKAARFGSIIDPQAVVSALR
jgi:subtilisin family serine protease